MVDVDRFTDIYIYNFAIKKKVKGIGSLLNH